MTDWSNMSIVDGVVSGTTPVYDFSTQVHGWLCGSYQPNTCDSGDYCPNNSASEGSFFYSKVTDSFMKVTGVETCYEAENVDKGTDPDSGNPGNEAIESDMNSLCK